MNTKLKYLHTLYETNIFPTDGIIITYIKSKVPTAKIEYIDTKTSNFTIDSAYEYKIYVPTDDGLYLYEVISVNKDIENVLEALENIVEDDAPINEVFTIIKKKTLTKQRFLKHMKYPVDTEEMLNTKFDSEYDIIMYKNSNVRITLSEMLGLKNYNNFLKIENILYGEESPEFFDINDGVFYYLIDEDIECTLNVVNTLTDDTITINLTIINIDSLEQKNIYFNERSLDGSILVKGDLCNLNKYLYMDGSLVSEMLEEGDTLSIKNISNNPFFNCNPATGELDVIRYINLNKISHLVKTYEVKYAITLTLGDNEPILRYATIFFTL